MKGIRFSLLIVNAVIINILASHNDNTNLSYVAPHLTTQKRDEDITAQRTIMITKNSSDQRGEFFDKPSYVALCKSNKQ